MGEATPQFLSDAPLAADKQKDVVFGHSSIARNLASIVRTCPKPFTIGFFGKWGTGKTTVLESLYRELANDDVLIVPVDAWKYEGDSLRRQFLINLDECLNLDHNYARTLNQSLSENDPTRGKFKFDKAMFFNHIAVVIACVTMIAAILKVLAVNPDIPFLAKWSVSFDLIFNLGLAGYLIQLAMGFFQRVSVTITEPRTDSAEGFELRFHKEVLNHPKVKDKDLLIVIDNLDRCQDEKAVEMLSTIKTFLTGDHKKNKCIFLVACDDDAIKAHIKEAYSKNPAYDADEFLRKFFNASVRIPPFIDTELQSYTEKLLKETKVKALQTDNVAHVITTAFRENPRQIKQFINSLLSTYLLAQDREQNGEIKQEGLVTGNPAVLAKILVLQQKYEEAYRLMLEENKNFEEVREAGIGGEEDDEIADSFSDFMETTRPVRIKNIRPFLFLKQSEEEQKIPSIQDIEEALINHDDETFAERVKEIGQETGQWVDFMRWLPDYLDRNKQRTNQLRNCVETLLVGFIELNASLTPKLANNIARYLTDKDSLYGQLKEMPPYPIWKQVLPNCDAQDRIRIVSHYVTLFSNRKKDDPEETLLPEDFSRSVFQRFLENHSWVQQHNSTIKTAIREKYFVDTKLLRLLDGNEEQQKLYLDAETLEKLLGTVSDEDALKTHVIDDKLGIIQDYIPVVCEPSDNAVKVLLQIVQQRIASLNTKSLTTEKGRALEVFGATLRACSLVISNGTDTTKKTGASKEMSALTDTVIQGLSAVGKPPQRLSYTSLLLELRKLDAEKRPTIQKQIQNSFSVFSEEDLPKAFSTITDEERQELLEEFDATFNQRFQEHGKLRTYLYGVASEELRTKWLVNMIGSSHYPQALAFLEDQKHKVDDGKSVLSALIARADSVNPPERQKVYLAINNINWKGCTEERDAYISQLQKYLTQTDLTAQGAAYIGLEGAAKKKEFTETNGRDIARPIIEWMDDLPVGSAIQTHAIEAVILLWKYVQKQGGIRSKFVEFVGYKLIKESNSTEHIQSGFRALQNLTPAISEKTDKQLIDDLRSKANSDGNETIKEEIKKGLNGLGVSS